MKPRTASLVPRLWVRSLVGRGQTSTGTTSRRRRWRSTYPGCAAVNDAKTRRYVGPYWDEAASLCSRSYRLVSRTGPGSSFGDFVTPEVTTGTTFCWKNGEREATDPWARNQQDPCTDLHPLLANIVQPLKQAMSYASKLSPDDSAGSRFFPPSLPLNPRYK